MESMEWGVDSRKFRWNPWNGGWTPDFFKMDSMKWGMDSMDWGMDSILFVDGFHIFFTIFTSPHLNPCGLSSFENLVKLSIYNVFNRTTYINLF